MSQGGYGMGGNGGACTVMGGRGLAWGERKLVGPKKSSDISELFKPFQIWLELIRSKDGLPVIKKFQNKIWICRELNKEQCSLLEIFKIRDKSWIKNQGRL
jgi:hypothetical protein